MASRPTDPPTRAVGHRDAHKAGPWAIRQVRGLAEYRRMRTVYFEQADTRQARLFEPRPGLFGGPAYLIWVVVLVACHTYRRYGYEVFQACPDVSEYRLHCLADILRTGPTASRRHQQRSRRLASVADIDPTRIQLDFPPSLAQYGYGCRQSMAVCVWPASRSGADPLAWWPLGEVPRRLRISGHSPENGHPHRDRLNRRHRK